MIIPTCQENDISADINLFVRLQWTHGSIIFISAEISFSW